MNQSREICFKKARRAVIKVGSNVLTLDDGLNLKAIQSLSPKGEKASLDSKPSAVKP